MRELGLDGLSEDGRFLIARDHSTDETFHIPADRRLTSLIDDAPRGSTSGQLETSMESSLSPRDIQTRIRRGESPEEVAVVAGVPVEQINGFATPVLAEREYMCEQARKTPIRRKHVGGAGVLLGTLVDESVAAEGSSPDDVQWDSWRREDGRWTVVVSPSDAAQPATFLFDVKSRYVLPADEYAHDLVGDVAIPDSGDMAIADALREQAEAAAPVTEEPADEVVPEDEEIDRSGRGRRARPPRRGVVHQGGPRAPRPGEAGRPWPTRSWPKPPRSDARRRPPSSRSRHGARRRRPRHPPPQEEARTPPRPQLGRDHVRRPRRVTRSASTTVLTRADRSAPAPLGC